MILLVLRLTMLLAVATGAAWVLRRRSAALRAALWTAVLASSLLLPLLPRPEIEIATARLPVPLALPHHATIAVRSTIQSLPEPPEPTYDPTEIILLLYLLGLAANFASFVLALFRAHRLVRSSRPAPERIECALSRIASPNRPPCVSLAPEDTPPLVAGPLRPTILLPESAHDWDDARLERVLRHELAHVQRGDGWILVLGRLATAAYWFHPLVWWAARELRQECERAADDVALGNDAPASDYADELLAWAGRPAAPSATLPMARRGGLSQRLRHVLDARADRRRASLRARLGLLLSATLLAGLLPGVRAAVETRVVAPLARAIGAPSGPSLFRTPDGSSVRILYLMSMGSDLVLHAWDIDGRPVTVGDTKVRRYVKNQVVANPSKDRRWVGIVLQTLETDPDPMMQPYTDLQIEPNLHFSFEAAFGKRKGLYRYLDLALAPRDLKAADISITFAPNRYRPLGSWRVGKGAGDAHLLAKAPKYAENVRIAGLEHPLRWVRIPKSLEPANPWNVAVKAILADGSSVWATTVAYGKADEEFAAFSADPGLRIVRVWAGRRPMTWWTAKNLPLFPR